MTSVVMESVWVQLIPSDSRLIEKVDSFFWRPGGCYEVGLFTISSNQYCIFKHKKMERDSISAHISFLISLYNRRKTLNKFSNLLQF